MKTLEPLTPAELRAITGILLEHTLVMISFAQQAEKAQGALDPRSVARFREKARTCEQLVERINCILGIPPATKDSVRSHTGR